MRFSSFFIRVADFNSRPSARGDADMQQEAAKPTAFQFTPLREGRPAAQSSTAGNDGVFQFTPLREGRPEIPAYYWKG